MIPIIIPGVSVSTSANVTKLTFVSLVVCTESYGKVSLEKDASGKDVSKEYGLKERALEENDFSDKWNENEYYFENKNESSVKSSDESYFDNEQKLGLPFSKLQDFKKDCEDVHFNSMESTEVTESILEMLKTNSLKSLAFSTSFDSQVDQVLVLLKRLDHFLFTAKLYGFI